jgi:ribosome-associated protein
MIIITSDLTIPDNEISVEFIRSSGPGGQNVNKVSTAVQLRFDLRGSQSLPDSVKKRLARLAAGRLTDNGILLIEAHRYRTQDQNREDAYSRLRSLVLQALEEPKNRFATRPTSASKNKRIQVKKQRSLIKKLRQNFHEE